MEAEASPQYIATSGIPPGSNLGPIFRSSEPMVKIFIISYETFCIFNIFLKYFLCLQSLYTELLLFLSQRFLPHFSL